MRPVAALRAANASTRPQPHRLFQDGSRAGNEVEPRASAVVMIRCLTEAGLIPGCACRISAARPATCGDAIDVPHNLRTSSVVSNFEARMPDAPARSGDLGLQLVDQVGVAVVGTPAPVRVIRDDVIGAVLGVPIVRGGDGDRPGGGRRAAESAVQGTIVSGGYHDDDPHRFRQVDELAHGSGAIVAGVAPQAHVDDTDVPGQTVVVDCFKTVHDHGIRRAISTVEYLHVHQPGAGGDASRGVGRASAEGDGGDVRAVAEVVIGIPQNPRQGVVSRHRRGQSKMNGTGAPRIVDARVDNGDIRPCPIDPRKGVLDGVRGIEAGRHPQVRDARVEIRVVQDLPLDECDVGQRRDPLHVRLGEPSHGDRRDVPAPALHLAARAEAAQERDVGVFDAAFVVDHHVEGRIAGRVDLIVDLVVRIDVAVPAYVGRLPGRRRHVADHLLCIADAAREQDAQDERESAERGARALAALTGRR